MAVGINYNPDILSCLANLSSDEVFTPPDIANAVLDLVPESFWSDPEVKVLDPACKSGVFLREAAKRFISGLEKQIPDLQERVDHIFHKQLYGFAITELTGHMSRRSLYCSKNAKGDYSVSKFDNPSGNIFYHNIEHTWSSDSDDAKCVYCGASRSEYQRACDLEQHAYGFIHLTEKEIKELQKMRFDLIISNPPYQLSTGAGKQAKPIYPLFINQAKKLNPHFIVMIIPSRWFAGGMGLDSFRNNMTSDQHIAKIVDYSNAKECFPENSVSGGVCYFLWDFYKEDRICEFVSIRGDRRTKMTRVLNEFPVLVRYNQAIGIIRKILMHREESLSLIVSSISPFALMSNIRGTERKMGESDYILHSSAGLSYLPRNSVKSGFDFIDKYKVLLGQVSAEHAGEPDKDGMFRILTSSMKILGPNEICTHSYLLLGKFKTKAEANNLFSYLQTRFLRFLVLQALTSIHITKATFMFVPMQDFSKPWTDKELYEKYNLSADEIEFIESIIKPMDS